MNESIVTIQFGQAGNQIGKQFFDRLYSIFNECPYGKECYFRETPKSNSNNNYDYHDNNNNNNNNNNDMKMMSARAVLIDTEPKVVRTAMQQRNGWKYDDYYCYNNNDNNNNNNNNNNKTKRNNNNNNNNNNNKFTANRPTYISSGSANNWAYGYSSHGPKLWNDYGCDIIRKQVEHCDLFSGFLTMHSLAGGTGSGLGSYFVECLRDEYPSAMMINQAVWPYEAGEVIVQNYNVMLSLSHLMKSSDAVIVMENNHFHEACEKLLKIKKVAFYDINNLIAKSLAYSLLPSLPNYTSSFTGNNCNDTNARNNSNNDSVFDRFAHLCGDDESYRLLTIKHLPIIPQNSVKFSSFTWAGILKHMLQMQATDAALEEGMLWSQDPFGTNRNRSVAACLFLNGGGSSVYDNNNQNNDIHNNNIASDENAKSYLSKLCDQRLYAPWRINPLQIYQHPFSDVGKSVTMISNSQGIVRPLNRVLNLAQNMFKENAFLHHYQSYGIDREHFNDTFIHLEHVVAKYNNLSAFS